MNSIDELEPPKQFWYWAGLASISAVLKDNVYLPRAGDYYKTYPNIYVMFHADSGLKKGPPINLAKSLVRKVGNTRVISGRSSIQGILQKLGTAETSANGKMNLSSTAFICSSELSSSIVEDKAAADLLTDLYDRNYNDDNWDSLLKMQEFKLESPTITMLSATNEAHSSDFFSNKDVKGGFFARTFIIHAAKENTINSLVLPLVHSINRENLTAYLRKLAMLKGPFMPFGSIERTEYYNYPHKHGFLSDVGKIYDDWYIKFRKDVADQEIKDDTGTLNRFGDSVVKVAMLLSLAKNPNPPMMIDEESMLEAIKECEILVGNARRATIGSNTQNDKTGSTKLTSAIILELLKRPSHSITKQILNQKYWMQANGSEHLNSIMNNLIESGTIYGRNENNVMVYEMTPTALQQWTNHLKGKLK
jgi:hypothetical protein